MTTKRKKQLILEFSERIEQYHVIEATTWSGNVAGYISLLETPYGLSLDKIVVEAEYEQTNVLDRLMQRLMTLHDDKLIRVFPFSAEFASLWSDMHDLIAFFHKYGFKATGGRHLEKPAK